MRRASFNRALFNGVALVAQGFAGACKLSSPVHPRNGVTARQGTRVVEPQGGLDIDEGPMVLWYDKPANAWTEALPVGNGRLGGMVYGGPDTETIQLNENTFWSGGPSRNDNSKALGALSSIRRLLFAGDHVGAESMINQHVTASQLHGSKYQPIGNLRLGFPGHESPSSYYRELDLRRAVATTRYNVEGVTFTREVFASKPDQLIVVRLSTTQPGSLRFTVGMDGPLQDSVTVVGGDTVELRGTSSAHEGVTGQVRFDARARVEATGGSIAATNRGIEVANADEAVIRVSIATNFVDDQTLTADEMARAAQHPSASEEKSFEGLLNRHEAAFRRYFNRGALRLGSGSGSSSLPTDQRIEAFSRSGDPDLIAMYYQFGRYLLISSSQPGGQPANLQGLWNDQVRPPWNSKYTVNINTEMNYWPAEKTNLSELHEPLLKMVEELSVTGQQTAASMYGAGGWVVHHNTDIWRTSGVVDGAFWGMWPMGGAWLAQHLWERYLYTGDRSFLESIFPVLRSACDFYRDFLIAESSNQWLVVSPSISPENAPVGHGTSVTFGTTMDNQILFDLFSKTIRAASVLGRDGDGIGEYRSILERLPPMQIGRFGQLQEWIEDRDSPHDQHRHVSHLYGLFPSNQISPDKSPQLFDAARTSLLHRGDISTGWSMGWKVNLWARLLEGNHALELIRNQLRLVNSASNTGGTHANLFDAHPPFQIDGNLGCTSGIAEMLLQSQDGAIHILPALPDDWADSGGVKGLRAYGGFEFDFTWQGGEVDQLVIRSRLGGVARVRVPNALVSREGTPLEPAAGENPNPFFETSAIKPPLVSSAADLNDVIVRPTFAYDLPTEPGRAYVLAWKSSPKGTTRAK